jgi:8-oxo-dGTP diphosphatase
MPVKPIRNSAKAIIIRDGYLLATCNVDDQGDWYLLPGGGQEPGETLPAALVRECQEELGTTVEVGDLRLVREYIGRNHEFAATDADTHQLELMFECRVPAGYTAAPGAAPDAGQIGVAWLPLDELPRLRLYPRALAVLLCDGMPDRTEVYLGDVN